MKYSLSDPHLKNKLKKVLSHVTIHPPLEMLVLKTGKSKDDYNVKYNSKKLDKKKKSNHPHNLPHLPSKKKNPLLLDQK